jgi:hydrogenase nickel incorporation protein HypB
VKLFASRNLGSFPRLGQGGATAPQALSGRLISAVSTLLIRCVSPKSVRMLRDVERTALPAPSAPGWVVHRFNQRVAMSRPRIVEVRERVLKQNDLLARELRERFRAAGVRVVSLVSSPGAGKTTLLERTLTMLASERRVAALVGDLATENDALRLKRSGAPVKQITTGTVCHLDASMVASAITDWSLNELDMLFIENVGNLVCPSSYDLGEDLRIVLLSATEGEDKPLKYPTIFNTADVAVITKVDLACAAEFDREGAHRNIQAIRPGMRVFELSSKTGEGMAPWLTSLNELCRR